MALTAHFNNGPRAGKKNNLRNVDTFPKEIPVPESETKARNMPRGRYLLVLVEEEANRTYAVYNWAKL